MLGVRCFDVGSRESNPAFFVFGTPAEEVEPGHFLGMVDAEVTLEMGKVFGGT